MRLRGPDPQVLWLDGRIVEQITDSLYEPCLPKLLRVLLQTDSRDVARVSESQKPLVSSDTFDVSIDDAYGACCSLQDCRITNQRTCE